MLLAWGLSEMLAVPLLVLTKTATTAFPSLLQQQPHPGIPASLSLLKIMSFLMKC